MYEFEKPEENPYCMDFFNINDESKETLCLFFNLKKYLRELIKC